VCKEKKENIYNGTARRTFPFLDTLTLVFAQNKNIGIVGVVIYLIFFKTCIKNILMKN